jgi:hypothetical protein
MSVAKDPSEQAKRFIDASVKKNAKAPSKAAYTRAIKLAQVAIEELTLVAARVRSH